MFVLPTCLPHSLLLGPFYFAFWEGTPSDRFEDAPPPRFQVAPRDFMHLHAYGLAGTARGQWLLLVRVSASHRGGLITPCADRGPQDGVLQCVLL